MDPQLEIAREQQKIIVFWGSGFDALHVPDIWVLDVPRMSWKEVSSKSRLNINSSKDPSILLAAQAKVSPAKATYELQCSYTRATDGCVGLWQE